MKKRRNAGRLLGRLLAREMGEDELTSVMGAIAVNDEEDGWVPSYDKNTGEEID